jgi:hypothetical protein
VYKRQLPALVARVVELVESLLFTEFLEEEVLVVGVPHWVVAVFDHDAAVDVSPIVLAVDLDVIGLAVPGPGDLVIGSALVDADKLD